MTSPRRDDVTVLGSAALLTNAPHIFEFVDQDEIKRRLTSQNEN